MKKIFTNIKFTIQEFYNQCYNVCRWLPTIWKDKDWDGDFIVEILVKKLEHQRDFFLSDKTHLDNSKKVSEQIQTAIDKLNRTKNEWDFYESPFMEEMNIKWGRGVIRFESTKNHSNGWFEMAIDYENVKTDEDKAQYSKEFREGMTEARKQYMRDKREAYKYIADNIDIWWD